MSNSAEPIRVLLVATELRVGGAERCVAELAGRLDRARFDVRVVSLMPSPAAPRDALVQWLGEANVPVDFLDMERRGDVWRARRQLQRLVAAWEPGIVHSFLFHADCLCRVSLPRGHSVRWCAGLRVADPRRSRQVVHRSVLRRADRVVCVSRAVAEWAEQTLKVPRQRLVTIPNGIDVRSSDAPMDRNGARQTCISVGRLDRQKGLVELLPYLAPLLTAGGGPRWQIVGEGPLDVPIRQAIEAARLEDHVVLEGWRSDVADLLQQATVMLLPSRFEGMPNVVLEAMASSLPVVAFDVEGIAELLGHEPKQIVQRDNYQQFVETVRHFMHDPGEARRVGIANREVVGRSFSADAMVGAYERVYESLLR